MEKLIITISREYGNGGRMISEQVAGHMAKTDKDHANYCQHYTGQRWGERSNYH